MKRYFLVFFAGLGMVFGCKLPDVGSELNKIRDINHAIVAITIIKMPDKFAYELGEAEYDLTGIKVVGERPNGESLELDPASLEVEGFNTASLGQKTFYLVSHAGIGNKAVRTKIRFIIVKYNGTTGQWGVTPFEGEPFSLNSVTVESTGAAVANISRGNTGTPVEVLLYPANGFKFEEGSLRYRDANNAGAPGITVPKDSNGEYAFILPAYDIILLARFERITYRVYASPALRTGTIMVQNTQTPAVPAGESAAAQLGDKIQVTVQEAYAALFNAASLTYTYFDAVSGKEAGPRIDEDSDLEDIAGDYFVMPAGNTALHGSYVGGGTFNGISFHTPVAIKQYNVGATELDFTDFTFTKLYTNGSPEIVRYNSGTQGWQISLDGGAIWSPYTFVDPNQYFFGFGDEHPFDNTRLGEQPVKLEIDGKAAYFKVNVTNTANMAAACLIDRTTGGFIERYYRTLQEAVAAACPSVAGMTWGANNQDEIKLLKDMGMNGNPGSSAASPAIYLTAGKHIEIRGGNTTAVTISRTVSSFGDMFRVDGGSLSLSGKLKLDGGSDTGITATHPLVALFDGSFTMKGNDVILQNNNDSTTTSGTTPAHAGGVLVLSGTFTMEGGKITNTRSGYSSSSVVVTQASDRIDSSGNGTFNMLGGMIESPEAPDTHYGVYVSHSGTFTMSGSATVHIKNPIFLSRAASPSPRKIDIGGNLTPQSYEYNSVTISGIAARLYLNALTTSVQYFETLSTYLAGNRHFFRPNIFNASGNIVPQVTGVDAEFAAAGAAYDDTGAGIAGMNVMERHEFGNNAAFTVSSPITGISLMMRGGGGGGGGGGLLYGGSGGSSGEVIRIDNVELPAGYYTIDVGAGGAGGHKNNDGPASTAGGNGSDSSILLTSPSTTLYTAQGGAGGATKDGGSYGGDGGNGFIPSGTSPYLPRPGTVATSANGVKGGVNDPIPWYSSTGYFANGGSGGAGSGGTTSEPAGSGAGGGGTVASVNGIDATNAGCGAGGGAGGDTRGNGGKGKSGYIGIEFMVNPQ